MTFEPKNIREQTVKVNTKCNSMWRDAMLSSRISVGITRNRRLHHYALQIRALTELANRWRGIRVANSTLISCDGLVVQSSPRGPRDDAASASRHGTRD